MKISELSLLVLTLSVSMNLIGCGTGGNVDLGPADSPGQLQDPPHPTNPVDPGTPAAPSNPVWTTVRDFQLVTGKDAGATGLFIDNSGKIHVSGYALDSSSTPHWLVEKSVDGINWSLADDFQMISSLSSYPAETPYGSSVTQGPSGTLFIHGYGKDANNLFHFLVRKSSDGDTTWATADDFVETTGSAVSSLPVFADLAGALYHIGAEWKSDGKIRMILRKSTDQGNSWTTKPEFMVSGATQTNPVAVTVSNSGTITVTLRVVGPENNFNGVAITKIGVVMSTDGGSSWSTPDLFTYQSDADTFPQTMAKAPNGALFLTGYTSGRMGYRALIRKSADDGATWTTVDDFCYSSNSLDRTFVPVFDSLGNIFVSGWGMDTVPKAHWYIRQSTGAGTSWKTIGDYNEQSGTNANPMNFYRDKTDRLFLLGSADSADRSQHWIVRYSNDHGQTWSTIDDFQYAQGQSSVAKQLVVDSTGNVLVIGDVQDSQSRRHWVVRRLTGLK